MRCWGTDEAFMMLFTAGNRHYVGSTFNYMSSYYDSMLRAHQAGDFDTVTSLQAEADGIYSILNEYNGIIGGKELMRLIGVDCGPVRLPLRALTRSESESIQKKLGHTTFFHQMVKKNEAMTLQ
jgi:N-acetylneuraminate lyase